MFHSIHQTVSRRRGRSRNAGFEGFAFRRAWGLSVFFALLLVAGWLGGVSIDGAVDGFFGIPRVEAAAGGEDNAFVPTLAVHFLDVDQGDAVFITGDGWTMLIDAGRHDRRDVTEHLRRLDVSSIDLFILTHPHADHIGQCAAVMESFDVAEVWMSGDVHTTLTFERCIDAILASDAGYREPRAGETYRLGDARIEVLHPAEVTGDLNNGSVSIRLVYDDVAFVLTGDAEQEAEAEMLARGHTLKADVLKLGHHGSRTSSTAAFVEAVAPSVAVYSAGKDNTYGHPHDETLATLAKARAAVYGTDVHGTIVVETDGQRLRVVPERRVPALGDWIGKDEGFIVGDDSQGEGAIHGAAGGHAYETSLEGVDNGACPVGSVNLNTASEAELTRIIHVGPAIAARIVAARPFASVDDLLRVSGIGEARLADIIAQGVACVE